MKRMKNLQTKLVILALGAGLSGGAYAGTVTTTLDININVVPSCTVTASGITFPDYDGGDLMAQGDVTVNCTFGAEYFIALDAGNYYSAALDGLRAASNGSGSYLGYELYFDDITGQTPWGDAGYGDTYPAPALFGLGGGSDQAHTVYGYVYGGSSVPAGSYSDVVNVSVNY